MELDDFLEDYSDDPDEWSDLTPAQAQAMFAAAVERLTVVTAQSDAFQQRAANAEERAEHWREEASKSADRVRNNVRFVLAIGAVVALWGWMLYAAFGG